MYIYSYKTKNHSPAFINGIKKHIKFNRLI